MSDLEDSDKEEYDDFNERGEEEDDEVNSSASEVDDAEDEGDPEQILRDGIAWAKKEFEEERDRILSSIPESYKSMFGQIGFVKWGKVDFPVLILNPYNVPPGPVRNQWIAMYNKLLKQDQLERMTYLIYWYGAPRPSEFYSFQPRTKFTPYEVEAKKPDGGKTKLPSRIQEKLDSGIALTAKEDEEYQRYVEMEEDLKKKPVNRRRGDIIFQEGYESLTLEDAILAMKGESSPIKKNKQGRPPKKAKNDTKQKGNHSDHMHPGKKRGRPKKQPQEMESSSEDYGEPVIHVGKTEKRTLKNRPAKIIHASSDIENADAEVEGSDEKTKKKRRRPSMDNKDSKESRIIAEESIGRKKPRKIIRSRTSKKENVESDLGEEDEEFNMCQGKFSNLIERWKTSVESRTVDDELWMDLVDAVVHFSSTFILHHRLWHLLQESVAMMEELKIADLESFDDFRNAFQQVYKDRITDAHGGHIDKMESQNGKNKSIIEHSKSTKADEGGIEGIDAIDEDNIDEDYLSSNEEGSGSDEEYTGRNRNLSKTQESKKRKEKPAKKGLKAKHKMETIKSDREKRQKEQCDFSRCEQLYLPLIRKWKTILHLQNVEELQSLLKEADKIVEKFSASFIVEYDLSGIMKETKHVLKQADIDLTISGVIKAKLKKTYESKAPLMPKGFRPKKKSHSDELTKHASEDNDEIERSELKTKDVMQAPDSPRDVENSGLATGSKSIGDTKNATKTKMEISDDMKGEGARLSSKIQKPKNFFLKNLMKPSAQDHSSSREPGVGIAKATTAKQEKETVPGWVTGPAKVEAPTEDPRAFALEFLLQMASQFPSGKVDVESIALSIEGAIYEWSKKRLIKSNWMEIYWDKVHAIVAAICGKREAPGSLMTMILDGCFDVPEKLVTLSEDLLNDSFEGKPVVLTT